MSEIKQGSVLEERPLSGGKLMPRSQDGGDSLKWVMYVRKLDSCSELFLTGACQMTFCRSYSDIHSTQQYLRGSASSYPPLALSFRYY